jgi:hypothetical protein
MIRVSSNSYGNGSTILCQKILDSFTAVSSCDKTSGKINVELEAGPDVEIMF